jgi:DNA modification methylase
VFREVRRVLRDDGTLWLNLGDSYAANGRYDEKYETANPDRGALSSLDHQKHGGTGRKGYRGDGIKAKDLVGIPWMVAFALRADGWWLRSDIVWAKPNPMPESVTDRPTRSHEYLFLLTKSARYFYDADAIREGGTGRETFFPATPQLKNLAATGARNDGDSANLTPAINRNKRSVWTVATQPFSGAHFATFPPKLIEPCVLAGSPPKCCGRCGTPCERMAERSEVLRPRPSGSNRERNRGGRDDGYTKMPDGVAGSTITTTGWQSPCEHVLWSCNRNNALYAERCDGCNCQPIPNDVGRSLVLDPFAGAGTTGVVALRYDRDFIGIELNPDYAQMARDRIHDDAPLLNVHAA